MANPVFLPVNYNDLTTTTLRDLGKPKFTEIASDLQKHTAMDHLLRKNRVGFQSGYGIQWDVMVSHNGSAANVSTGQSDTLNDLDGMVQATTDWRFTTANYPLNQQIVDMNREPARIVDFVKVKRMQCLIALAELMESNFWGPPPSASDNITPWGVRTWAVKNGTAGFNGGAPSGFTTIGLNPTTYPRWKNYTFPYTSVSRDDFIRALRKAATFTKFKPPVDGIPTFNTGDQYGYYTNYGVIAPLEESLESQNDNLGADVASQDGKTIFRRAPVEWIPKLESDTTNPIYGLNWGVFKVILLEGWWLKETNIPVYPGQHTMSAHFLDCVYNFTMRNRRCHFVGSNGTSEPG